MIRRSDSLRRWGFRAIERRRGVPDTGQKQEAHPSCLLHCAQARTVASPVSLPSRRRNRNEPCRAAEHECQSQESVLSSGKRTNRGNTSYAAAAGTACSSSKKGSLALRMKRGRSRAPAVGHLRAAAAQRPTVWGPAGAPAAQITITATAALSVPPFRARRAQQLRATPTTRLRRAEGMDHRPVRDAHTTASRRSPRTDCRARSARRRGRNTR